MPEKIEFEAIVKFLYESDSLLVGCNKATEESAYLPAKAGYKKGNKVKVTIEPVQPEGEKDGTKN